MVCVSTKGCLGQVLKVNESLVLPSAESKFIPRHEILHSILGSLKEIGVFFWFRYEAIYTELNHRLQVSTEQKDTHTHTHAEAMYFIARLYVCGRKITAQRENQGDRGLPERSSYQQIKEHYKLFPLV